MTLPTGAQQTTEVRCYSGYTYAQEPRTFLWEGRYLDVEQVEERAQTPSGRRFRVRTHDGRRFRLLYEAASDSWCVSPFSA